MRGDMYFNNNFCRNSPWCEEDQICRCEEYDEAEDKKELARRQRNGFIAFSAIIIIFIIFVLLKIK